MKIILISIIFLVGSKICAQTVFPEQSSLNNARIVLLGEQTHGDGAVFDKKVELIEALHESLGFNIICFESGLYDNYKAFQLYSEGKEDISIFRESVFPIWSDTKAFKRLCDYVSKNPEIKILGFDSQEGPLFKEYYTKDLKELLNKNGHQISQKKLTIIEKTLAYLDIDPYINRKRDSTELYSTFKSISERLSKIQDGDLHTKIIVQTFTSAVSNFSFILKNEQKEKIFVQNPRDRQMAQNLIFLKEQFPDEKIIGWGASYHFADRINEFQYTSTTEDYASRMHSQTKKLTGHNETLLIDEIEDIKELSYANPMGKLLKTHYGNLLYSIGFTTHEGSYLGPHQREFPILTPPENSFESNLYAKNSDAKLVDAKDFPKNKFYTSVLGYLPIFGDWRHIFDGIFYIPKMYPPKNIVYDTKTDSILGKNNNRIIGRVFDSENKTPIPNVDVYYADNNKSVVCNSHGNFSITKSQNKDVYLIFSALEYQSDSILIKTINGSLKIGLKKTANLIALNEVVVSNKKPLTAKEIIKKARQKIKENYTQSPFNQQFFFRVQSYRNDSLLVDEEAVINTFFEKGNTGMITPENHIFGKIAQIRNTTKKRFKGHASGVGGLWTTLIKDLVLSKTNVLYHTGAYELSKEGLVSYKGKLVYKISFVNTSPGAYSTGYGYPAPEASNGFIYIDDNSFAILHYEHCIKRQSYKPKRSKFKIQQFHKIVQSFKEINGDYFINLFKLTHKTNRYSEKDNSLISGSYYIRNLMSTDIETGKVTVFERPIQKLKENLKLENDYDFWENNDFYLKDDAFKFKGCD